MAKLHCCQWRKSEADQGGRGGGGDTFFSVRRQPRESSPEKADMSGGGGGGGGGGGLQHFFFRLNIFCSIFQTQSRGTSKKEKEKKVHNVREHVKRVLISINNHPTQK